MHREAKRKPVSLVKMVENLPCVLSSLKTRRMFVSDIAKCPPPPRMKLLVLVNPYSGPGKAMQIYTKHVAPMLDEADIHVKVIQTG